MIVATESTRAIVTENSKSSVGAAQRPGVPRRRGVGRFMITTSMWVYALVAIGPLLIMVSNSFRTTQELFTDPLGFPTSPTVSGYVKAWTDASFGTYFVNSLFVTIAAVLLSTTVSLLAAYAIARWRFRGSIVLEGVFLSGLMIPVMLAILPMFYLMDDLGLVDSEWSIILIYAANGVPFSIFIFAAFFRQLPEELEEAARIDGAGPFTTFWRVMLPLVRPAVATVIVFRVVPIWNDFIFPLVLLRSTEKYTLPVGLTTFFGEFSTDWSSLFAGLVIATIPLVLLFILATKQIVSGLTAGIGK